MATTGLPTSGLPASGSRKRALPTVSRSLQALALLVLVLILGATTQQLLQIRAAILADTENQMARLDMVFAEQTGRAVETVDFILRSIAAAAAARPTPPTHDDLMAGHVAGQAQSVRQLTRVAVVNAQGDILVAEPPARETELPPAGLALLETLRHDDTAAGPLISEPIRDAAGAWRVLMMRPIRSPGGALQGAAVAWINLAYFEDFYRSVELSENGAIILHHRDGTVLARYPHSDKAIGTSFADLPPFKDILSHAIAGTVLMDSPIDGSVRVLAIRALKAFPLAVQVSVDESKVLADWRRQAWIFALLAVVASAVIVWQLLMLARRSREVESLAAEFRAASENAQSANAALRQQMAERERAEAALRQAQRIEAVGQLTGGVAHDFNNLLTVILGNIDIIESSGEGGGRIAERLVAMRGAAERGARLTSQLLAFARRQPLVARPVDLNALVTGMEGLLRSAVGGRIGLHLRLAPGLWPALVDPTQIELVILNLTINARDAMAAGGELTIETANTRLPAPDRPERAPAGDYVMVRVGDTGIGMAPDVLARAFEPFFTTKPVGAGSGLGLSQVLGTARQSGGDVRIESQDGLGTSVTIHLPRATVAAPPPPVVPPIAAFSPSEHGLLLLVDDDEAVRTTTAEMLRSAGFRIAEAADGPAAIDWLRREPAIALMLTDVAMPGMNGVELAAAARRLRPGMPVLFMSGFADLAGIVGNETIAALIRKPFRQGELIEQVARSLQGQGAEAT